MKSRLTLILLVVLASTEIRVGQILKTPTQGAQQLFSAWRSANRTRARQVATEEAVNKLFEVRQRKMTFKGCHKREEGDFECLFEDRKHDITLAMLSEKTKLGYRISSLSFSTEAQ